MTPYEAYRMYIALKLHFSDPNYDYFKYKGHVNVNEDSFRHRRDRYFFEKLAKHRDVQGFLVSALVGEKRSYIRNMVYDEQVKKTYADWLKVKESLSYIFSEELSQLKDDVNSNFISKDGQHPYLLRLYLGRKISLETLCILCDLSNCLPYWDKKLKNDVLYDDIGTLIKKYLPFIEYDKEKFRTIVRNKKKGEPETS